ncbi:Ig-like domain-containing protein [Tannerella sp.]|uniref:Ig-like domain-containing protein n=1 Tax=Tannerella sp. TaxID=2382127 RepID=UPI003FA1F19A
MKRTKQFSIWIIALLAMTVTNYAWAADTVDPKPGGYKVIGSPWGAVVVYPISFKPTEIEVRWNPGTDDVTPQNKLRYNVMWKKLPDGVWEYSHESNYPVNITSYTITGLQPNTEYKVDVSVRDEAGNRVYYGEKKVKTKAATTPAVSVMRVTLNRNTFTINADYSIVQLTATVYPSNASNKSLTWASSDPTIVSVDSNGLVTIHKKGKARVTATANDGSGQSGTCVFDVIRTVANETVDGLRVYAHGGALYLTLPAAQTVHIYNVQGALVKTLFLPAGDHVQPLTEGMYLVRVGEQVIKVMVK